MHQNKRIIMWLHNQFGEGNENVKVVVEALEMQIPKKPIYSDFDDNGNDEIVPYKAVCPVCGHEFEFGKWNDEENHHCICGQKIDWEGEVQTTPLRYLDWLQSEVKGSDV